MTAPSERGAEIGRRIGVGLMYGLWKPRVLGAWKVPATGPAILAVNHSHNIDGPMVMGVAPRPTHFLIKKEAFIGPLDPFLLGIGQLKVDRETTDRTAISDALGVLSSGGVLGIFPEGTRGDGDFASLRAGLAYFAVRSGAPIVPVAVLGSSEKTSRLTKGLPAAQPGRRRLRRPLRGGRRQRTADAQGAGRGDRPHPEAAERPPGPRQASDRTPGKRRAPHRALGDT